MLDIRATSYVSPVSEVTFESVPLTVHIVNVADETGLVTGKFRVYNDSTGLLIHTSDIAPLSLAAGIAVDVSALTDFDPPAPADDVYFVIFDGNASNALVPDGINFVLGKFDFDVKPVGMGPAPAAHAGTHEEGGSDEIEVADMGTAELDDTLVLSPDGAGGVEWEASPAGVTDHGALTGLTDDDHTQYRLRHEIFFESEFFHVQGGEYSYPPWHGLLISTGTQAATTGLSNHPGIIRLSSSVNANSGVAIALRSSSPILLAGGEISRLWHRPQTLSGTTRHHGFHDTTAVTDPVDGVWIWQDPATGIIYGRTRSNSVGSTTGTGYQLVTNTWYFEKIVVNAAATRVDFYLYDGAGALLWTDNLTTNIPTAAGRELAHGIVATNSGTTAVALDDLDYLSILIPDRRPDL
jgi:hypothetical protein